MSRLVFCCQACASAFLYFVGELAHGLLRNSAPFAMTKRSVGLIDCSQDFCAGTLAVFPQGKSFPHGIFFRVEPAACDGVADKRLLVWCELYFHRFQNTEKRASPATSELGTSILQQLPDPAPASYRVLSAEKRTASPAVKPGAVARTVILPDPKAERTVATALPWYNFTWLVDTELPWVRSAWPGAMSRPAPATSKVTVCAASGTRLPFRSTACTTMVDTCRPSFRRVCKSGLNSILSGGPTVFNWKRAAMAPAFFPRISTVPASFGTTHTSAGRRRSAMGFSPSDRPFSNNSTESQLL